MPLLCPFFEQDSSAGVSERPEGRPAADHRDVAAARATEAYRSLPRSRRRRVTRLPLTVVSPPPLCRTFAA
jgi:hypothetical protein